MNYQNRYTYSQISLEDEKAVCEIFNSQSFEGNLAVQYLRGETPVLSFMREGDELVCVAVKDTQANNKLIGIGCCVIRKGYVNENLCNIGYLTGLKLLDEYQKQFLGIANAYKFIEEQSKDKVDYYYTTILSDNTYAQKMLEKKRKNMPSYHYLCDYDTFIFKTGGKIKSYDSFNAKICSSEEVNEFYINNMAKQQFSIKTPTQNFLKSSIFIGLYENNSLIAFASISDQRNFKQYVVKKYGGIYSLLRFLPTKIIGYPSFPKINQTVSLSSCAVYYNDNLTDKQLKYFLSQILAMYTKTNMLIIGVTKNQAIYNTAKNCKSICYKARLYQVSFNKNDLISPNCAVNIDVAFQ